MTSFENQDLLFMLTFNTLSTVKTGNARDSNAEDKGQRTKDLCPRPTSPSPPNPPRSHAQPVNRFFVGQSKFCKATLGPEGVESSGFLKTNGTVYML